nr:complement receptor type 1-like isoform X2 [Pogona vitticeps]
MRLLPCSCEGLLTWALVLLVLSESHGDCPAPQMPPFATLGDSALNESYPVGTTLRFRCIPGYIYITGSKPTIQCLNDSTWSETPTFCERKQCKIPALENGKVESSGDFRLGDEAKFICDGGYRLIGPDTALCVLYDDNTVNWDKEGQYCERIPCERPPTISNGTHNGDTYGDHYTVGSVVTYTCNKDFSLIGDPAIECVVTEDGRNGKWNRPAPECRVVQCSRPEIENGKLTSGFQASYPYGHKLQYVCNPGYTVMESEFIECVANSSWHPDPKCVKEPSTTTVPLPPGRNETSRTTPSPGTTQSPGVTVSTVGPGTTQSPGVTVSTVGPGPTQSPATVDPGPDSATVAVGKLSLIVALLILIM